MEYVARAIYLGLVATILPGPQQTFAINSALSLGWRRSSLIAIAPLLADLPVIVLALWLLRQFPSGLLTIIQIIGGVFILYLALLAYRSYRAGATIAGSSQSEHMPPGQILRRAILMNLLGPGPYVFWSSIHGPAVIRASTQSIWLALAYVAAFYGTFFIGILSLLIIFDRVGQINPRITRMLILLTIIALALFGIRLVAQGIGVLP